MIVSMTGYANAQTQLPGGALLLELRSVNHRYLEISFRLHDDWRPLEPALREGIAARLTRGKVECRISFNPHTTAQRPLEINLPLLAQLTELNTTVRSHLPDSQTLRVLDVLRWPGMLGDDKPDSASLQDITLGLLKQALDDMSASRQREGAALAQHLLDRAEQIEKRVADVKPKLPALVEAYQGRLTAKLQEAMASRDDERVRQEVALFAQKIDVDEELSRLTAHIKELRRIVKTGGAVGKRLDFLMQELNREANTLGSKSVSVETSQVSMELKVLIEQMREQIQNIE